MYSVLLITRGDPTKGDHEDMTVNGLPDSVVAVESIARAKVICEEFVLIHGLSLTQWKGGWVYRESDGGLVGRIDMSGHLYTSPVPTMLGQMPSRFVEAVELMHLDGDLVDDDEPYRYG